MQLILVVNKYSIFKVASVNNKPRFLYALLLNGISTFCLIKEYLKIKETFAIEKEIQAECGSKVLGLYYTFSHFQ